MAYGNAATTNNVAEYNGLVNGLRQAKEGGYKPLHVVGDSAMVLSQLRTYRPPRKPNLALLYQEARDLADEVAVVSWGHHYRDYNKMADRAANIAMDGCTSAQVHTPTSRHIVSELEALVDNDVLHWLETSTNEHADGAGPRMNARDRAISRQHHAQRRAAVRDGVRA